MRRHSIRRAVCLSAAYLLAPVAVRGEMSFTPLGDLAGGEVYSTASDISADGSVVVGQVWTTAGLEAFRWTQSGGMVTLGDLPTTGPFDSAAEGVSADGLVVVGRANVLQGAFRWTSEGGMVALGHLAVETPRTLALGVSGDGAVIVGYSYSGSGDEAFRWTQATGIVGLGDLPGGQFESFALDVSIDGSVVVGASKSRRSSVNGFEAFRWTQQGGMVPLGAFSGGSAYESSAFGVSADGSVVVGSSRSRFGEEAFRWTQSGGMAGLGDLAGGRFQSTAYDVSADGTVIVGAGFSGAGNEAFIWNATQGMRSVKTILENGGLATALAGWQLTGAEAVSANGRIIVGRGLNPSGFTEGWIAVIPEPPTSTMLLLATMVTVASYWRLAREKQVLGRLAQ